MREVLIPQGHAILLTSRPAALASEVYEGCGRLQLCPLSPPQQRDLIRLALGGPAAPRPQVEALLEYVLRLPPGSDGQLIGASPLALQVTVRVRARVGVCVCV